MDSKHAVFYHGPFEQNFSLQRPGKSKYVKRDGKTRAEYRGPAGVRGLKFGQMETKDPRALVVTRIQSPGRDICLKRPVPGLNSGPQGAWISHLGAKRLLEKAIRVNREQRAELIPLRQHLAGA